VPSKVAADGGGAGEEEDGDAGWISGMGARESRFDGSRGTVYLRKE
jgi:hypothetical protein